MALSPPPSCSGTGDRRHDHDHRVHLHDGEHSRKKQKVTYPETESRVRIQTLKSDSTRTFSTYTRRRKKSRVQREEINRGGWHTTYCQRNWTLSARDVSKYIDRVVIVSYNILGVENATKHPHLYAGVPPKYFEWEYRKKLLCKEVRGYQASILCLQEVDRFDDLNNILQKDGFGGLYKARAGEAHDGCAIFWKTELFTLLHEENIEFQKFGLRNNVAQLCVLKVSSSYSDPDTSAAISGLGMNQDLPYADPTSQSLWSTTSRSLVVGNIHVLYNPKRGDIKLAQIRVFLEKAYALSQKWGCVPVVVTGDLNSLPQLHIQKHDRRHISGQICPSYAKSQSLHIARWRDEEIMLATGSMDSRLSHPLELLSAYAEVPGCSNVRDRTGEPLATSHHRLFTGTVDYIWHTSNLLPVKVLETLPMHDLKKIGCLPNKEWGSDHLAVACELAFADDEDDEA